MKNQCQHLTETQHNELLKLLQKVEELFGGKLGTLKNKSVDFKLKRGCEADMFNTIYITEGTWFF